MIWSRLLFFPLIRSTDFAWREGTLLSPIHNNKTCSVKPGFTERKSATEKEKLKFAKKDLKGVN